MVGLNLGLRVTAKNLEHRGTEDGFEIVHPTVAFSKLPLDRRPRDELWLLMRHSMQALCEPGVDVQSHGRV